MMKLVGKTAIVTGATSGIGKAICTALATSGVRLCLLSRDRRSLQELGQEYKRKHGVEVNTHVIDLSNTNELIAAMPRFASQYDKVDILVHSAGVVHRAAIHEAPYEQIDLQIRVNFIAPVIMTQHLIPSLRSSGGTVVFVNSSVGRQKGKAELSTYCAQKHALRAFSESLRAEENSNGIRVLDIFPGRTATAMQEQLVESQGGHYQPDRLLQPEDIASLLVCTLGLAETAEVTDIEIRPFIK